MPTNSKKQRENGSRAMSRLLKVMRAKDDGMFVLRVQGAAVQVALQRFQENAPEPELSFAVSVLENPSSVTLYIPTLLAGVTQITDQIQINGSALDTSGVQDDVLIAGVRLFFALAAKRYGDVHRIPSTPAPAPTPEPEPEPTPEPDPGTV